jgi:leucyl aminopeptidase
VPMNIHVAKQKPDTLKADLFVVPVQEGAETSGAVKELRAAARSAIEARVGSQKFKGKAGATLLVQTPEGDVVLCGTGKNRTAESLRRAAAKGLAAAAAVRARSVVILARSGASSRKAVEPLLEGFVLNSYRFDKYRSKKNDESDPKVEVEKLTVAAAGSGSGSRSTVERVRAVCDAVFLARDLINEMSSVKTPTYLGKQAKEIAKKHGLECQVWQGEKLVKERMNGILRVSAGSNEPGAFIKLVYKPKKKSHGTVALVGKGITFDSGGLSIKPWKSMEWMKQDMSGAAAVLATVQIAAQLALPVEVRGYVASAENMTGGGAQKPGDIITYRNGTTAEVLNTDAEGRLVLGDALCVANEEKPDCIIDLATLTGACMVALGTRVAGVLGNDQKLVDTLISHGNECGEDLWQLPIVDEYMDDIRSFNADIQNTGSGWAGTITAALFLRCFVGDTKWAHLDIAGPAFAEKPHPYAPKGGTGFGIRTLVSYLSSL